jgi:hypothetical protein
VAKLRTNGGYRPGALTHSTEPRTDQDCLERVGKKPRPLVPGWVIPAERMMVRDRSARIDHGFSQAGLANRLVDHLVGGREHPTAER